MRRSIYLKKVDIKKQKIEIEEIYIVGLHPDSNKVIDRL
jgi:hypothetical protein